MFNPANQPQFTLTILGLEHDLHVLKFTGHEAIGQPYRFDLERVSERARLNPEDFHHRLAHLSLGTGTTSIHGQVQCIAQGESGHRLARY